MAEPRLVVGAVIVDSLDRPTRVLAARRSRPEPLAGCWEFPGGKVEAGESAREALVREVREELSVTLEVGPELWSEAGGGWPLPDGLGLRLFLARIADGQPSRGDSHDRLRWLGADELDSVDWLPADRLALPGIRLHPRRLRPS